MAERDPEAIKADIDAARDRLALTVDSLAERPNPHASPTTSRPHVLRFVKKPAVAATLAGVGAVTVVLVIRRVRNG